MIDVTKLPFEGMTTHDALNWVFLHRNPHISEKTGIQKRTIEHMRFQHARRELSEWRINKLLSTIFKKENDLWHTK